MSSQSSGVIAYRITDFSVAGLCSAPIDLFTTMTFELTSTPVGASGSAGQQHSLLTLSREVDKDSPILFSACTGSTPAKAVVIDFLDGTMTVLSARLTNAYPTRYAQYSTYLPVGEVSQYQHKEEISIAYDQLSIVAIPLAVTPQPNTLRGRTILVSGLCKATTAFSTRAFEVASGPGVTPARGKRHYAPVTLSRLICSDSVEVFNAYASNSALPKVVITWSAPAIKAGTGVGAAAVVSISTLTNARVTRYTQYSTWESTGVFSGMLHWEEISLDYESISVSAPPAGASPSAPS